SGSNMKTSASRVVACVVLMALRSVSVRMRLIALSHWHHPAGLHLAGCRNAKLSPARGNVSERKALIVAGARHQDELQGGCRAGNANSGRGKEEGMGRHPAADD